MAKYPQKLVASPQCDSQKSKVPLSRFRKNEVPPINESRFLVRNHILYSVCRKIGKVQFQQYLSLDQFYLTVHIKQQFLSKDNRLSKFTQSELSWVKKESIASQLLPLNRLDTVENPPAFLPELV